MNGAAVMSPPRAPVTTPSVVTSDTVTGSGMTLKNHGMNMWVETRAVMGMRNIRKYCIQLEISGSEFTLQIFGSR